MSDFAPIVICGGSLAGAATALRLKQLGFQPTVVEKAVFPRDKLCGGFLGPDSFAVLDRLGLWDKVLALGYGPIEQAVFYPMSAGKSKPYTVPLAWLNRHTPYGLSVCRDTLDALLLEEVKAQGIPVLEGTRIHPAIQRKNKLFHLELHSRTDTRSLTTPLLLDASGRHGGLRILPDEKSSRGLKTIKPPKLNRNTTKKPYVGIKLTLKTRSEGIKDKQLHMLFFPGGYGGIQPINETRLNVCMLVEPPIAACMGSDPTRILEQTILQNPQAQALLQGFDPTGEALTTSLSATNQRMNPEDALLRVGDAQVTVDPVTGSGMGLAIETGVLMAECVAEGLYLDESYEYLCKLYQKRYLKRFAGRLQMLRLIRPFLFSAPLQNISWPLLGPVLPLLARALR